MRDIKVFKKEFYGVEDNGVESVPFIYLTPLEAIEEWACFERWNTESEPHRGFLNHVTTLEEIDEIVNKYKI